MTAWTDSTQHCRWILGLRKGILTPKRPFARCAVAIAENPTLAEAHNTLGKLLGRNGADSEEVLPEFEEAVRLRPDFAEAHNNLVLSSCRGAKQ